MGAAGGPGPGPGPGAGAVPGPLTRLPGGRGMVALAIDLSSGAEPATVRRALHKLQERGMAATWFATGRWAERNRYSVREVVGAGQALGNHGYDHTPLRGLGLRRATEDIRRAALAIAAAGAVRPRYFRPPLGECDSAVQAAAAALGHRVVLAGIDSLDWQRLGAQASLAHILSYPLDGAIISLHASADRFWPVLDRLLAELVVRRHRAVTLDQGLRAP